MEQASSLFNYKRECAGYYANQGIALLPLCWPIRSGQCSCGRSCGRNAAKHPLSEAAPHGVRDASADPTVVGAWWQKFPDANIGIALGQISGGLIVMDIDVPDLAAKFINMPAGTLPADWKIGRVRTARGVHLYFRSTQVWQTKILHSGGRKVGELRGDGAYVVAPPSQGAAGHVYEWLPSL